MHLRKTIFAAIMPATLLAACATASPVHQPLPVASRDKFVATEVVVPIRQNDIYLVVPTSNAGAIATGVLVGALPGVGILAAGLIGGMGGMADAGITSANAGAAQTALKPLRDAMADFRFDETLQGELKTALTQAPGMNADGFRIVKEVTDANLDSILAASKASAVLFVTTDYRLSQNADMVTISISSSLFPNSPDLKAFGPKKASNSGPKTKMENAIYRNVMSFRDRAPNASVDRAANISVWSAENGAAMRVALKGGSTKLAEMLAADLQASPSDFDPKAAKLPTVRVDNVTAYVVSSDEQGSLVRFDSGAQMYLSKAALAELPKPKSKSKAQQIRDAKKAERMAKQKPSS